MSLSEIPPGNLRLLLPSGKDDPVLSLADIAAETLRTTEGSYSLHFVIPDSLVDRFSTRLFKKAGKRHASRYRPTNCFDTFQALQHPPRPLLLPVRRRLAEELAELSMEIFGSPLSQPELDHLVADHPDNPLAQAYLAGIDSLGYKHPFTAIEQSRLAASITSVFVASIDLEPLAVRSWLLAQLPRSVDIIATVTPEFVGSEDPLNHADALLSANPRHLLRPQCQQHRRSFDSVSTAVSTLTRAVADGFVDAVYCASPAAQRMVEIRCLLDDIPLRVNPLQSILHSQEILTFVAYLDWLLDESEEPLLFLLEKLGTSPSRWYQYARKNKLPRRLSVGCYLSTTLGESALPIVDHLKHLSELLTASLGCDSVSDHVAAFIHWASRILDDFDPSPLHLLALEIDRQQESPSLSALRRRFYSGMSPQDHSAPELASRASDESDTYERVWALIDGSTPSDQSDAFVERLKPRTTGDLVISSYGGA